MSRQELADAANQRLPADDPDGLLTANDIGKIERGVVSFPRWRRRAALRDVLGADSDAAIGLFNRRGRPSDARVPGGGTGHLPHPIAAFDQPPFTAALTLDDLDHLAAAMENARRYTDAAVLDLMQAALAVATKEDGRNGARAALPGTLGILAMVRLSLNQVPDSVRSPLLRVGARTAEFAGWLYRDAGVPALADHWRDRATEWSLVARDVAMPGYVLIKKSQAAWDDRDPRRMLDLTEAVQEGPWVLPSRVRAEAVQQEARAIAMLSGSTTPIDDKLALAAELLAFGPESCGTEDPALAAHYDPVLFEVQMAICFTEAGRLDEALHLYDSSLSRQVFSLRDYAYFLTLKAQTLAALHLPDRAAEAGATALRIAVETRSARTLREVTRLQAGLGRWPDHPAVRRLGRLLRAAG
ncbi:hypothetical protein Aca07nite_83910 [Actinoplanes capillaceus]|uniref:Helix-turn-helix domain-containing protein n=1 Tax=Actinoplanes campanulatus TaxID=113559 RepID=A0ABQ3WY84_9ACTN|nr:hypothetical protein [Actinoplanes capillaceus]GID51116.1 hypothetical protein Aca07nite_83910 [Actinoplanes capillaceus]